jgi:acetyl-CoA C-acetyltransferase
VSRTAHAVIVSAVRTPMGSFNGMFSQVPATKLGSLAIAEALKRVHVPPDCVEQVYMGCVLGAGLGQAPARQASIGAGIPHSIGATTVNKVCGSSLQTVIMASQAIALGEANIVIAGGMENMTRAPYLLEKARQGYRLGHAELVDSLVKDGLWDVYNNFHMGNGGELCAAKYRLMRKELDDFALESYRRAREAIATGIFAQEIAPVEVPQRKGPAVAVMEDEEPNRVDLSRMRELKPRWLSWRKMRRHASGSSRWRASSATPERHWRRNGLRSRLSRRSNGCSRKQASRSVTSICSKSTKRFRPFPLPSTVNWDSMKRR